MRAAVLLSLALSACNEPFLHSVEIKKPATDTGGRDDEGPCAPPPPTELVAQAYASLVQLQWVASGEGEGIIVERRGAAEVAFTEITRLPPAEQAFSDFGAQRDEVYAYRLRG